MNDVSIEDHIFDFVPLRAMYVNQPEKNIIDCDWLNTFT